LIDGPSPGNVDYELGRLLANQGKVDAARKEFELVVSGMWRWLWRLLF